MECIVLELPNKLTFAAIHHQMLFMKYIFLFTFALILFETACSPQHSFKKDKASFEASKVIMSFTSVADLNDSYFDIKENNFFEFYRQLFDSVKNTSYPGRYTQNGDTIMLNFYDKKGETLLGKKAVIKKRDKEILFLK